MVRTPDASLYGKMIRLRKIKILILSSILLFGAFYVLISTVHWMSNSVEFFKGKKSQTFPKRSRLQSTLPETYKLFFIKQAINDIDMDIQLSLLDAFHDPMKKNEIPYFMHDGTLLGSWRHHGFIPWDDDLDLAVPKEQRPLIHSVLSRLEPQFLLANTSDTRWKFYSARSHPINDHSWRWPYIDIFFYNTNQTHVYDEDLGLGATHTFRKEAVFPLQDRPFMRRMFPAPLKPEVLFKTLKYNPDICSTSWYDHSREVFKSRLRNNLQTTVQCKDLEKNFLFVHRMKMENGPGCNETLVENGTKVVSWFYCESCTC